jgi:Negative regulator of sigma F
MSSRKTSHSIEHQLDSLMPHQPPAEVAQDVEQAITGRLLGSLRAVRPLPGRAALVVAFLAIFAAVTAVLVAVVGTRGAQNMTSLQLVGMLAAIVVAALLASFSLSGEMSPGQRRAVHPAAMIAGILFVILGLIAALFPWTNGSLQGWHCFLSGFLCSLPAVVLVLWVVRKGTPLAFGTVGATAGLLGGLVGLAAIHVGCSLLNAPHMAAGHLTIPLAAAIAGYLAGRALPYLLPPRNEI